MKAILACAVLLLTAQYAAAQCCQHCGCQSNCRKVCRVICEVKKVPKVTYDCECEDICIPGPSCRTKCCDECGNHKIVYTPTCGEVRTRTKLVRNETVTEKVVYKWVVQTMCNGCEERCAALDKANGLDPQRPTAAQIAADAPTQLAVPVTYQAPIEAASDVSSQPQTTEEKSSTSRFDLRKILSPLAGNR